MSTTRDPAGLAVFGEALVDIIPTGDVTFEGRAGGAPANVAVAAARLGMPTTFLGGLSTDRWGRMLAGHLAAAGVSTDATPRSDRPTAMALVDLADDGSAVYRFLWEDTADRVVALDDLPRDLGPTTWLQVGSVAAAFADTGAVAAALVDRERSRRLVACDPNVRTMVHGSSQAVRERLRTLVAQSDLVKASDEDLAFLLGDTSAEEAIQRLLADGAGVVAVTRGGDGAVVGSAAGTVTIPPVPTTLVDTVGAGDTFMAGLLVGLSDAGVRTREQLRAVEVPVLRAVGTMAATAAAITVSRQGADPPTRGDMPPDVLLA